MEIPVIDLSDTTMPGLPELIVKACEEHVMFKVVNHNVSKSLVNRLEDLRADFFSRAAWEKQQAGSSWTVSPAKPLGYGSTNIGFNGDMGVVEYLFLQTRPTSVSKVSNFTSQDPTNLNSFR